MQIFRHNVCAEKCTSGAWISADFKKKKISKATQVESQMYASQWPWANPVAGGATDRPVAQSHTNDDRDNQLTVNFSSRNWFQQVIKRSFRFFRLRGLLLLEREIRFWLLVNLYLSVYLSIYLFACLSFCICLFVFLSLCPSIYTYSCLSMYL